jgi:tetrahydromethanopterin S-methyltransferase subunit F
VKKEFAFTKVVPVPLLSPGVVALELKPELDAIVLESGANAIVELRIRLIGVDGRAARGVQATRGIGAIIGAIGGGLSIYAYGFSGWDEPALSAIGLSAAGFGLAGCAAFGASFILERRASVEYTYEIRGKAVKIIN